MTANAETYDPRRVINGAIGSDDAYCMGYLNPDASGLGYISTLKLSVGTVDVRGLDDVTERIVAYDRCEKNDAYIGQINMLTASSFCGLNGAVWGYDLAVAEDLRAQKLYDQKLATGRAIPVYSVAPLLDATVRLFGIGAQRRFPPMPGAHVVCANKDTNMRGPGWVWSAIALAILADRSTGANLFIEDVNTLGRCVSEARVVRFLERTQREITNSVALCGEDQSVEYKEIFVGTCYARVPKGHVGSALSCAPYVTLARNAIPAKLHEPGDLTGYTIGEWEAALDLTPLPPRPLAGAWIGRKAGRLATPDPGS